MTRRSTPIDIAMTAQALRVGWRARTLTIVNAARPGDDSNFVVRLDEIEAWDAPNDDEAVEIEELQRICEAIEDYAESEGVNLAFE